MTVPVGEDDLMAWVDGRLPPERAAMVDAFIAADPALQRRLTLQAEQARALAKTFAPIAAEPIPANMRIAAIRGRRGSPVWPTALAASLLLGLGFGGGWMTARQNSPARAGIAALADEATDSYRVYASDMVRPVELGPADREVLIRWASARTGRKVAIPNLGRSGYRYVGGRLVATPHGPAALLIYDGADQDRLALLTRPMQVDKTARMAETRADGVGRVSWAEDGIGFSMVSERSPEQLHPIADEVRRQLTQT